MVTLNNLNNNKNEKGIWVKRITDKDFDFENMSMEELINLSDMYILQQLKDKQLTDVPFEIIEPKQLPESKK